MEKNSIMKKEMNIYQELINFFSIQKELYGNKRPTNVVLEEDPEGIQIYDPESSAEDAVSTTSGQSDGALNEFYFEINTCKKCALSATRNNFVFGTGNPDADLMFVGEAPGRDEDLQGKPFVGRAGQLLTLMLNAIHLKREDVFIANVLKCRPPNNRDPQSEEIEKCEPYLLRQIDLISPKLIITLGRFASASLLRTNEALGKLRTDVHQYNNVPLIVMYHPAALLRNPLLKRNAWDDLKKIQNFLS